MGLKLEPKEGDPLLSPEELEMLIPSHITTRKQLDEVEQDNIEDAIAWLISIRTLSAEKIFSHEFQDQLHLKMLEKVWKWAGKHRTRETNIGIFHTPAMIEVERRKLNDDALFWCQNNTWPSVELAIRFHHRLVQIHCYPNGNGRHSRIIADIIMERLYELQPLNWKAADLINQNEGRKEYINALKSADQGDYAPLLNCVER